ncbi:class GN sortase [Marinobacter halotolerans]|uniref:class GN sortase n=1 Tax=Marinobacter halotolerans TaxID=1569211 RepID=UPI00124406A7|nr:class GN sortase [Marinobacter halotolerans]
MKHFCTLVTVCSFTVLAFGLWIPFKAVVAQQLLELAWAESQARQQQVRPWPWADTWPVARLTLQQGADDSGRSLIVLDGAHGESLAFGPGQVFGSGDSRGPVIIAGHRDTHFKSLQTLEAGHDLRLQGRDGQWQSYRVIDTRVVDSRHQQINTALLPPDTLLLVTCYPFDGLQANGPLRYVVEAKATPSELVAAVVER